VVSVTRPSFDFEETVLDVYNSKVYLSGKPTFKPVTLVVRDDVGGVLQALVGQQVQKQFDFQEQAAARSGIDYKFTTRFEVLDGGNGAATPTVLETWELYGCYLKSADYGTVNYSESKPMQIALGIMFDNANQTPNGSGVGSTIARTVNDVITG
jgi:hypothetical protein